MRSFYVLVNLTRAEIRPIIGISGMKIFISWSGERSNQIATVMQQWIGLIFQAVDPFFSSESIRSGQNWLVEIGKNLSDAKFGIVILNRKNMHSPWILFESGALAKELVKGGDDKQKGALFVLCTDGLTPSEITDPLRMFMATKAERNDILKMVTSVNDHLSKPLDVRRLETTFEAFWPQLEKVFEATPKDIAELPKQEPKIEDVVKDLSSKIDYLTKKIGQIQTSPVEAMVEAPDPSDSRRLALLKFTHLWPRILKRANALEYDSEVAYLKEARNWIYNREEGQLDIIFPKSLTFIPPAPNLRMASVISYVIEALTGIEIKTIGFVFED